MEFYEEYFLKYMQSLNSERRVPIVLPYDLSEYNSNIEISGLEPVQTLIVADFSLSIIALVNILKNSHELRAREGDLAGPYVYGSGLKAYQKPGFIIYRKVDHKPQSDSGI